MNNFWTALKRYFVSGILVVVPIYLTWIVISFVFESIDDLLRPFIHDFLGYYTIGMGVLITVLVILLAGVLTRNIVGAKLHNLLDRLLAKLPLIRPIYSAAKQLLEAITLPSMGSFQEVVLVEYPRKGIFAIGFVSRKLQIIEDGKPQNYVAVFVASTPTPISGMAILFPDNETRTLDFSVEEAVKFLVSGGVVSPDTLREKLIGEESKKGEVIDETR